MAGAVPGFREFVHFPAHHVVYFQESLLGVSACPQLVVCGKGRNHHLHLDFRAILDPRGLAATEIPLCQLFELIVTPVTSL